MGRFVPPAFCGFAGEISNLQVGRHGMTFAACAEGSQPGDIVNLQLGSGAANANHATQATSLCACPCGSVAPSTNSSTQPTDVQLGDRYRVHTASITLLARRSVHRAGGWGLGVGSWAGRRVIGTMCWCRVCPNERLAVSQAAVELLALPLPVCLPAGTRQWRRGADLESSVANFVESEQLVVIDGGAVQSSFVQVRSALGEVCGHDFCKPVGVVCPAPACCCAWLAAQPVLLRRVLTPVPSPAQACGHKW